MSSGDKKIFLKSKFNNSEVLITGASGLTGVNLAKRLVDLNSNVTLLLRNENIGDLGTKKFVKDFFKNEGKVKFIYGDITNLSLIQEIVKDKEFIFHLASQSSLEKSMEDPFLDLEINCKGTLNILESCKKFNKQARIVYTGTIREAGPITGASANEDQKENPKAIYDLHKLTSEKYLQIYAEVYGLKTTTLRLSNVFGDGQIVTDRDRSVVNYIIWKVLAGKELQYYGSGGPLRDYNYVGNVVDACLFAVLSDNTIGKYYTIGSGEGKSFLDVMNAIVKLAKEKYNITNTIKKIDEPALVGKTAQGDVIVNYSKFFEDTGWKPEVNFTNGLVKTIDFYKDNIKV